MGEYVAEIVSNSAIAKGLAARLNCYGWCSGDTFHRRQRENTRKMIQLSTGQITHDQLLDEAHFIQNVLEEAGVWIISVCCAFGVDVDHPLFARDNPIEVAGLADSLRHHEETGAFRLGQTNITLTYDYEGLKFFFGNDEDVFCEGEESPQLDSVRERWASRYPFPWLPVATGHVGTVDTDEV